MAQRKETLKKVCWNGFGMGGHSAQEHMGGLLDQVEVQLFFGYKVIEQHRLGNTGCLGDVRRGGLSVAVLSKDLISRIENALPLFLFQTLKMLCHSSNTP